MMSLSSRERLRRCRAPAASFAVATRMTGARRSAGGEVDVDASNVGDAGATVSMGSLRWERTGYVIPNPGLPEASAARVPRTILTSNRRTGLPCRTGLAGWLLGIYAGSPNEPKGKREELRGTLRPETYSHETLGW